MEAPGNALSAGKYSSRRVWQALSEGESPGPPEGPGEYCVWYMMMIVRESNSTVSEMKSVMIGGESVYHEAQDTFRSSF